MNNSLHRRLGLQCSKISTKPTNRVRIRTQECRK